MQHNYSNELSLPYQRHYSKGLLFFPKNQDLENRLAATGTDVSKTLQDMQSQIRENFKQIDLLWEHAYRTNKPNIAKNTNAIVGIRKQLDNELEPLTQSVRSVESRFTSLLDDVARTQQELRDDSEEMTTQVALIRGQVQDQFSNVTRNSRNIDSIKKELSEAQEAIDAIDTYRRQINLLIVDLQKQIQAQATPIISAAQKVKLIMVIFYIH